MAKTVKAIPEGYNTITPSLTIRGAAKAIDFYKKAFGIDALSIPTYYRTTSRQFFVVSVPVEWTPCVLRSAFSASTHVLPLSSMANPETSYHGFPVSFKVCKGYAQHQKYPPLHHETAPLPMAQALNSRYLVLKPEPLPQQQHSIPILTTSILS